MAKLTKKIRRAISVDESIRRYFHFLEREMSKRLLQRARMARIEQITDNGVHFVLKIQSIYETPEGLIIHVR